MEGGGRVEGGGSEGRGEWREGGVKGGGSGGRGEWREGEREMGRGEGGEWREGEREIGRGEGREWREGEREMGRGKGGGVWWEGGRWRNRSCCILSVKNIHRYDVT